MIPEQFATVLWTIIYILVAVGIVSIFSWGILELLLKIEKMMRGSQRKRKAM